MRKLLLGCVIAALASSPALAASKVYDKDEAAALRCAAILTVIPNVAVEHGFLGWRQAHVFNAAATVILTRYVSGTPDQKHQALMTVAQRYTGAEHVRDFKTKTRRCLRQFPVT